MCFRKDFVKFIYNNQFSFIALPTKMPNFSNIERWFGTKYENLEG